ncbi:M28 family peptidase [uncultured Imperialibacter sp.]|uniref:M28 family peptidase n=1 Tax=uncultured Imperialibacter sp. TaxID=1672639 RepID=UPI0030D73D2C|tara:strand:- start:50739 stop:52460 length:1722 start_codon:yes stop_codon:yes gene_type:complete
MKNIALLPITFILLSCAQPTAEPPNPSAAYFDMVRPEVTGDLAYETTVYVEQFWRLAGNAGFDSSIYRIVSELQRAGYVPEENATKDNRLVYRIEKRALSKPTWEPVNGELSIKGDASPLLSFATNRNMLPIYSTSTPEAGIGGQVVFVEDIEGIAAESLKGKIAMADANPRQAFEQAVQKGGALALLTYNNPDYLQPEKNVTSIQFRSIPYQEGKDAWCVALSWEAREKLKNAMAKGKVELNVKIETKIYPSEELTVVANVRGSQVPDERLVFSAHVQEPGANDNASGTGTQVEMAAVTARLVKNGNFNPKRTITFLWGDEIVSTRRYIEEDSLRASNIKWGISLDMVGENTAVTGGSFLIEKMPDPSAIWTRGKDKHTEWGAGDVTLADMKPHYFNDFMLNRFMEQGKAANWQVSYNPFEGGSDHVPFLEANIPGLLLWHFTDQFYHTDNDRLDKVSKETERNVATAALASAFTLVNADHQAALAIISEIKSAATNRLNAEAELSKQAAKNGASASEETQILSAWADWYVKALGSVKDMEVGGASAEVTEAIETSQKEIQQLSEEIIGQLR